MREDISPTEKKLGENPNDRAVNLELGQRAEDTGDLLRAEQYYVRAEALGEPAVSIMPRILRVLVAAQRYADALLRCNNRLERFPDDRPTRFVRSALFVALEQPARAEQDLNTLVRTKPEDGQAYLALGRLYKDVMKDAARGRAMLQKYLDLDPNGEDATQVRFELAEEAAPK